MPLKLTNKPLDNIATTVSSEFGSREKPNRRASSYHKGMDFGIPNGTSVYAAHDGKVIRAGFSTSFGNFVTIQDQISKEATFYAHLSSQAFGRIYNGINQPEIRAGAKIGRSGNTGTAANNRYHLHFEIYSATIAEQTRNKGMIIDEKGNMTVGPAISDPRLNPRPYLTDLAIDLAKTQLGYRTISYNLLSPAQKEAVKQASCKIFSCDVKSKNYGIELNGDYRDNNLFANSRDNIMNGDKGNDSYYLTFTGSAVKDGKTTSYSNALVGQKTITDPDNDGKLIIDTVSKLRLNGTANCVSDDFGKAGTAWLLNSAGKQYYLLRVNDYDEQKLDGAHLLIVLKEATNSKNSVRINNFNFEKGAYGLTLENSNNIDSSKIVTSGPLQVNDNREYYRVLVSIATLNDGKIVEVWASYGQDGSGSGIFGRVLNSDGSKYSAEFQVNSYSLNSQLFPALTVLSNNKFMVVWQSQQGSSTYGIYGRIFNPDGSESTGEFQINSYGIGNQTLPQAATLSDNKVVVVWESKRPGGYDIYGQFLEDNRKIGSEFKINSNLVCSDAQITQAGIPAAKELALRPRLATLNDGKFVVGWVVNGVNDAGGVYAKIFQSNGKAASNEIKVVSASNGNKENIAMSALKDGGFVVSWDDWDFSNMFSTKGVYYGSEVYAQIYNQDGRQRGMKFRVNTNQVNTQYHSFITSLKDGGFAIIWEEWDYYKFTAFAQMFSKDGQRFGQNFAITPSSPMMTFPVITCLPDNKIIASWAEIKGQNNGNIYLKIIDSKTNAVSSCLKIASLKPVPDIIRIANNIELEPGNSYDSSKEGDNIFELASLEEESYSISNFKEGDKIDLSLLEENMDYESPDAGASEDQARRLRRLQSNNLNNTNNNSTILTIGQFEKDSRILLNNYGIVINLKDYDKSRLNPQNFVGNVTLDKLELNIIAKRQINFEAKTKSIPARIEIQAEEAANLGAMLSLKDANNQTVDFDFSQDWLNDYHYPKLNYSNGTYFLEGKEAQLNYFLNNFSVNKPDSWKQDFSLDFHLQDLNNNITNSSQTNFNFQPEQRQEPSSLNAGMISLIVLGSLAAAGAIFYGASRAFSSNRLKEKGQELYSGIKGFCQGIAQKVTRSNYHNVTNETQVIVDQNGNLNELRQPQLLESAIQLASQDGNTILEPETKPPLSTTPKDYMVLKQTEKVNQVNETV